MLIISRPGSMEVSLRGTPLHRRNSHPRESDLAPMREWLEANKNEHKQITNTNYKHDNKHNRNNENENGASQDVVSITGNVPDPAKCDDPQRKAPPSARTRVPRIAAAATATATASATSTATATATPTPTPSLTTTTTDN